MKKFLWFLLGSVFFAGVALAAPYYTSQRSLIPADTTENVGTSTARWDEGWFNSLNVTSCTGCSSGSNAVSTSSSETATYIPFWTSSNASPALLSGGNSGFTFNNTATRLTVTYASTTSFTSSGNSFFGGFVSNASSTFSNLGTGSAYVQNGLILSVATTSSSSAYGDVWRDANQNAFAQNFISAGTAFPTNGGTVTLTNASPRQWTFTGTLAQTMQLPSGTTLTVGTVFTANNNSTGVVTIVDNGSNVLATVPPGGAEFMTIYDISTTNGTWDVHARLGHANVSGTDGLGLGTTTPWGALAVNPVAGEFSNRFVVGSSTATNFIITNAGLTGVGTTSPYGSFTINSVAGVDPFAIGSTTGNYLKVDKLGRLFVGTTTAGTLNTTSTGLVYVGTAAAGTVTSVATGDGLSGGTITTSGTLTNPFAIATTSSIAISGAAYFTQTSGKTTLGSVATATPTGVDLSFVGTGAILGSLQINNPYKISTTSVPSLSVGNLAFFSGTSPTSIGGVGTTSPTCSGLISCSNLTTVTNASGATSFSATYDAFSHAVSGGFTSATTSALGIGTTTPFSQLSVSTSTQSSKLTSLFAVASTTNATLFNVLGSGNVGVSSTSPAFTFSVNNAGSDFYITSAGKLVGRDTTNGFTGRISPTRSFVLGTATTTTWTASTSGAYVPFVIAPFAGTIKQARCQATSTKAFLGVAVRINTTSVTPSYFVSSTTVGTEHFTANNTFVAGDRISATFGTTTSDANALGITCTFDTLETP